MMSFRKRCRNNGYSDFGIIYCLIYYLREEKKIVTWLLEVPDPLDIFLRIHSSPASTFSARPEEMCIPVSKSYFFGH